MKLAVLAAVLLALAAHALESVHARARATPENARIGAPVVWELVIEHPSSVAPALPDKAAAAQGAWAVVADLGTRRADDPARPGMRTTTVTWRAFALEGGELASPFTAVAYEEQGVQKTAAVESAKVRIANALAAGEDAPRPVRSFRPAPDFEPVRPLSLVLVPVALVALALAVWIWRRRRRRVAPPATLSYLERLAALELRARNEPDAAREIVFALTRLVRQATDAFVGEDHAALVDSAWVERYAQDERVPLGARTASARLLTGAERIKYALEAPSPLAIEASLREVRGVLEALATTPKPATAVREVAA
jgi:hypothetical protein